MMENHHKPVLLQESIEFLITGKTGCYFEGTLGFGGHSEEILKRLGPRGILVSTDLDESAFIYSKKKFAGDKRAKLYNFNFSLVDVIAKIESIEFFDGILADLGVSSFQLDNDEAGFSYSADTELDMRFDKNLKISAADIVNNFDENDLTGILKDYGEERNSKLIARKICELRKIKKINTTGELKELISQIVPERYLRKSLSRIFQALRIYVNSELDTLKSFLSNSVKMLNKGGHIVVISYHSLEDRIVKDFFKYENLKCICPKDVPVCGCNKEQTLKIITRKPVIPSVEEIQLNKRARSAKLRVAERI
ncbi:MAG: 16S rRNA (cytosine(1402)-N(4))-methyltransferase RsmH [Ignavibacteriaceae bacterium]|nr:16S rRNA (cytosine(1402)-N(4))-methyltransferase RsmH [Ignavibacteriaceae bacterium]